MLTPALHQHADRPALTFRGRSITFAELDAASTLAATQLRTLGVRPGDRVAAWLDSSPALVIGLLATWKCRAAWVPLNTRYRREEAEHVLTDASPSAILVDNHPERNATLDQLAPHTPRLLASPRGLRTPTPDGPPPASPTSPPPAQDSTDPPPDTPLSHSESAHTDPVALLPTDLALLLYTSGTTGPAKGVEHTAASIAAGIGALTDLWQFTSDDRLSLHLPLFHVHGLGIGVIGSLLKGVHLLLHERFSPEALVDDAREHGATVFMGVPTMYFRLLGHLEEHPAAAEPLRGMRLFTSGSAALSAAHHRAFEERTGHRILERYGMTETLLTLSNPYAGERRPGFVGLPVGRTEIRIFADEGEAAGAPEAGPRESCGVERGELGVRGPSLMRGYRGLPEATESSWREGFFLTGDEVERGADGYVRIVGRRSTDLIKSGGFRIAAGEIEEVLLRHGSVAEAAVVGVPDEEWGERIVAAVVLREGAAGEAAVGERGPELATALSAWVAERLAPFKQPREVRVMEALPRNALGKVQKVVLRREWG